MQGTPNLSCVVPRLPDFRISPAVEDTDHTDLCFAYYVEDAIREPAKQCPAKFAVDRGMCEWIAPDLDEAHVQALPKR